MQFLKLLWRGLRDVYEQFAWFILLSILFWIAAIPAYFGWVFTSIALIFLPIALITMVLVPPALLTLFYATDPRLLVHRPDWSDMRSAFTGGFVRSWKIGLVTILPLIMIGWNIAFFAGTDHMLTIFVPLWVIMWVFLFVLSLYMFCLAGTHESGLANAFRGGMYVLVKYPFRSLFLALFTLFVGWVFTVALLPMLVIGPPLFAAIVTRFVFDALEVHVIDPNSPTDEREWERERGINPERSLVDRVMRRNKDT